MAACGLDYQIKDFNPLLGSEDVLSNWLGTKQKWMFEVRLNKKLDKPYLLKNIPAVINRYYNLEKRLIMKGNDQLCEKYVEKVSALINGGTCVDIGSLQDCREALERCPEENVLPTNMVQNARSATTSHRLCIDGSQNRTLLDSGPNLLVNLVDLLIKFRSNPVSLQFDLRQA